MLPGKRDFYRCCKARRSASHVNKEFQQQFQNYAPPSLRVIRTNFARTIIGERAKRARHSQVCSIENRGYIYVIVIPWLRGIIVDNCPDSRGRSPSERAVSVR